MLVVGSELRESVRIMNALRSTSTALASVKPNYETIFVEQSGKLRELSAKFLNASSYTVSSGASVLENIIFNLSFMCSILRAHSRQPSHFQEPFQLLLDEALQLASLTECYLQNYGRAMQAAKEAERYAKQWHSYDLLASSILRQCFVSLCLGKSRLRLAQYQRAADIIQFCSQLMQSHILVGLSEAQASAGLSCHEHRSTFQAAIKLYPHFEDDPDYSFCYFGRAQFRISTARYHIAAGNANAALTDLDTDQPVFPGRDANSVDAQSVLAETLISLESVCVVDAVVALAHKAVAMGSRLHFSQAQDMYEALLQSPAYLRNKSKELAHLRELVVR